jgi:zinc protease
MANLTLDDKEVLPERQVIIEERRTRTENNPNALLREQMNAALFLNHPYHNPVIGWRHEMAGLTRDDAIDFYKHHYAPNNAILIVSGDVTADELRPLAERTYGRIPAPPRNIMARSSPAMFHRACAGRNRRRSPHAVLRSKATACAIRACHAPISRRATPPAPSNMPMPCKYSKAS